MSRIKIPFLTPIFFPSLFAVVCFLFGSLAVYLWVAHKNEQLKANLSEVSDQIEKIEAGIEKGQTPEEGMMYLQERYTYAVAKFPAREEEALRMISDLARRGNIKIIDIKSQPKMAFLDQDQQRIETEGKTFQKISVVIEIKGSYKDFIKYLEELKHSLSTYFTIEGLRMRKDHAPNALGLDITVDINFYLLS